MEDQNVISDSSSGSDIPQPLDDAAFVDMGLQEMDDDHVEVAGAVPIWDFFNIDAPPVQGAQAGQPVEQPPPANPGLPIEQEQPPPANPGPPPANPGLPIEQEQPAPANPGLPVPIVPMEPAQPNPQPANPNFLGWRFLITVLGVFVAIGLLTVILLLTRHKNHDLPPQQNPQLPRNNTQGCVITNSVSKDGKSDFRTISEAVEASPDNSPLRVCIFIGAGEYEESVTIGSEKTNLILVGEGSENTTILSNSATPKDFNLIGATLYVSGFNTTVQDLTISNTAESGVALKNWADESVFFRCILRGRNGTLNADGRSQFYRGCDFYGRNYLVSGSSDSFFQKCNFISEESQSNETIVLVAPFAMASTYHIAFTFHQCGFNATSNGSPVYLGSAVNDEVASIVVMQCNIGSSVTGYFLSTPSSNGIYFAIFDNTGLSTMIVSPLVQVLTRMVAQSRFSLKSYLDERRWVLSGVDYDLDLAN